VGPRGQLSDMDAEVVDIDRTFAAWTNIEPRILRRVLPLVGGAGLVHLDAVDAHRDLGVLHQLGEAALQVVELKGIEGS